MHIYKITTNSPAFLMNQKMVGNTKKNIQDEAEPAEGGEGSFYRPQTTFSSPNRKFWEELWL